MCQCKVICSNRTLSLMFGCKARGGVNAAAPILYERNICGKCTESAKNDEVRPFSSCVCCCVLLVLLNPYNEQMRLSERKQKKKRPWPGSDGSWVRGTNAIVALLCSDHAILCKDALSHILCVNCHIPDQWSRRRQRDMSGLVRKLNV
ncbi:unnamed protein product [Tetraodon nigroviridis]|uniref:(spotted green pufferfish) hypothetical protein n=1 Tax=Tetraodon nigroviridis TaxID=99883 RepID=Q4SFK2_TETNG|nr:unnamed protein product [Tetraodon nigroviridis]